MELYKLKNRNNIILLLKIQYLNFALSILLFIVNLISGATINYLFFSYYLLFSFLYITVVSLKVFSLASAFNLFLFGYFMFQISALFVSLDTLLERKLMDNLFLFSEEQINNTLCANSIILNAMFLGCLMSIIYLPIKTNINKANLIYSERLQNWGYLLFWAALPFTLLKFYLEIKLVLTEGYYAYYTSSLSIPFLISISRFIFEIGFFLFLTSLPQKKKFLTVSKVYILVMCLFFLIGVRNRVILSFLFVLWFYYRFYSKKSPKILFLLIISISSVALLLLVQLVRQAGVFLLSDDRSIFSYFFYAQSTNFYILPLLQYYDLHTEVPFVFAPFFNLDTSYYDPNGINNLLGNAIAFRISPDEFREGHGLGSSFIAELYDLGIVFMSILSIGLGFVMGWFERNVKNNRALLAISFYAITNCIYISRSSLFRNVYMFPLLIILVFIALKIRYPFKMKKNEYPTRL